MINEEVIFMWNPSILQILKGHITTNSTMNIHLDGEYSDKIRKPKVEASGQKKKKTEAKEQTKMNDYMNCPSVTSENCPRRKRMK